MGSAAYRRGSACIARTLAAENRPQELRVMETLNRLERDEDAGRLFGNGPVRIIYDAPRRLWWLQDAERGDRDYGYCYRNLRELCKRWHIRLTAYDASTQIWQGIPT